MIRYSLLAVACGVSLISAPALAQSEADQDACTPDVFKLCQDYIPNEGPIVACLKAKGASLSPACHEVMFRGEAAAPATAATVPRHGHIRHRRHRANGT